MKIASKILVLSLFAGACSSIASAAVPFIETSSIQKIQTTTTVGSAGSEGMASREQTDSKMIMPYPYENSEKTYTFNEIAARNLITKTSSLIKVNCDTATILKSLGFVAGTKTFSVGVESDTFDYSFDLRSCSMRGNKRNNTWTNKPITEAQAIASAKAFLKNSFFKNKVFSSYGDPIVVYKNGNNGGPILYRGGVDKAIESDDDVLSGVEIDTTDTGDLEQQYTSFSIMFPYQLNGKAIYNAYGNRAGITVEVTAEGVTSTNAQLLPFKGAIRNAEKLSADDLVSFVKRGGNNQFRGKDKEIKLDNPQRILVMFNVWRNNTNEVYLSSGIRFGSKVKVDQRATQNYEMIISDYKIGNNNYGY